MTKTETLLDNRYKIGRLLGEGGMGQVFQAVDTKLHRDVAVKFMKSDAMEEEGAIEGFVYECHLLANLEHPGILPVIDQGVDNQGVPYCVMKIIKGKTLGDLIFEHQKLKGESREENLLRLLNIFSRLCDTMAFVHYKRYIHRDVKPENVMVDEFGVVLLVDWGLARPMSIGDNRPEASRTSTGLIKGTPLYMSPEQVKHSSEELDGRSDLFALGSILYEILVGRTPFEAMDAYGILSKIKTGKYTAPQDIRSDIPPALCSIVNKALKLDANERYQTTQELGADVTAYLDGRKVKAHNAGAYERFLLFLRVHPALAGGLLTVVWLCIFAIGFRQYARYAELQELQEKYEEISAASHTITVLDRSLTEKRQTLEVLNSQGDLIDAKKQAAQELSYRKTLAHKFAVAFVVRQSIAALLEDQRRFYKGKVNEKEIKSLAVAKGVSIEQLRDMLNDGHTFRTHFMATLYLSDQVKNSYQWDYAEIADLKNIRDEAWARIKKEGREKYGNEYPEITWENEMAALRRQFYLYGR